MYVPVSLSLTTIKYFLLDEIKDKTTSKILKMLDQNKQSLVLQTPAIRYRLRRKGQPVLEHPQLANQEKQNMDTPLSSFHLAVLSPNEAKTTLVSVKIKTETSSEIPLISVPFNNSITTGGDLIEAIKSVFPFASPPIQLFFKNKELLEETPLKHILSRLKKATKCSILFCCKLDDIFPKKIRTREQVCKEFVDTEKKFIDDLHTLQKFLVEGI